MHNVRVHVNVREMKERRKKEASKVEKKQLRQSNTANPSIYMNEEERMQSGCTHPNL